MYTIQGTKEDMTEETEGYRNTGNRGILPIGYMIQGKRDIGYRNTAQ